MNKKDYNVLNKKIDMYASILFIVVMLLFTTIGLYGYFQLRIFAFFLIILLPIFFSLAFFSIIVLLPLCIIEETRKER